MGRMKRKRLHKIAPVLGLMALVMLPGSSPTINGPVLEIIWPQTHISNPDTEAQQSINRNAGNAAKTLTTPDERGRKRNRIEAPVD